MMWLQIPDLTLLRCTLQIGDSRAEKILTSRQSRCKVCRVQDSPNPAFPGAVLWVQVNIHPSLCSALDFLLERTDLYKEPIYGFSTGFNAGKRFLLYNLWWKENRNLDWKMSVGIGQGTAWHSLCQRQSQKNWSDCTCFLAALIFDCLALESI